jgi:putative colanic acid biosynthesis acetyltransferase WcaF
MSRAFSLQPASISLSNRALRVLWGICWCLLYRPTPRPMHAWRRVILRLFGARIAAGVHPYPAAKIWAPWNLTMETASCLSDHVDCYSVAPITIGAFATVSQYTYLCSASHDYRVPTLPLVIAPIVIEAEAWVAAAAFVGPGVRIGEGAIVGARATVTQDVAPWVVVAGSPATPRGQRPRFKRASNGAITSANA